MRTISKNNGVVSMGRVGNSSYNREAEYLFSILKSERLKLIYITKITFDDLSKIINEFIFWYFNESIQSKLDWKTLQQRWDDIMSN
ncbi:hypothetical protein [Mycoplasma sp. 4404]|uniref:hypothetical protein n=1 Tax=Mycoplasma sp. 4404 TaxID=3108530 RepID=UPI002B1DA63C|nr:hypothetical protein [Mycoplasma sp. 4404]MEA4162510.1 hypothetical protein [Mycoplasma sp. 4404]